MPNIRGTWQMSSVAHNGTNTNTGCFVFHQQWYNANGDSSRNIGGYSEMNASLSSNRFKDSLTQVLTDGYNVEYWIKYKRS